MIQNPLTNDASFYKQLFERSHIVKLIIDPVTSQIIEANSAACTFYGYTYEQLTLKKITDINIMSEGSIRDVMRRVIDNQETTFQTQHRLASGIICDVEVFACAVERDTDTYLYAIVTDITAQEQSKKALRESEALYRLFAQNMPDSSVLMFDNHMRYTLVEGPFLKRFDTFPESMLGKTPQESLQPEVVNLIVAIYRRALNGEAFSYERSTADYAYESFVSPVRDESGNIIGGMVLTHDITKRHLAAIALQESEIRYQSVIEAMAEGVVIHGRDGSIQACNPAAERILGLSADQMMGRTAMDPRWRAIHEDGSPFPGETHPTMISLYTGQPLNGVIMGVHKPDDTLAWVSINSRALIHPNESVPYASVASFVDITERKRLEEALRASEERLRVITDSVPDLITQGDAENRITYANPAARMVLGIEPEALVGQLREAFIHPDDLQHLGESYKKGIESGVEHISSEGRLRHMDGHYVHIETTGTLLYNTQSDYIGTVFISRDITERKNLYNLQLENGKLEIALAKEHELSDLKTRMMERIAHEFRTPLTVIQVSMESLMAYYERMTATQREQKAATVRNHILRITDMLDEIGLIVRGTFTPEGIHRYPTDVSTICRDLAIYLAGYFNLPDKFVLRVPETTVVTVDPTLIRTALLHIMRNASHFSEPSTVVTVDLTCDEGTLELRVSDTGIGILPEELPRIFDTFFRGSNINERGGLGVGLTIARAAVEAQGGKITVESVLNQGTTVTIHIPIAY